MPDLAAPSAPAPSTAQQARPRYRAGFDEIRGVAILLVLAFHFNVPGAHAAGRVGVTLFLVLSAYLIAGHLLASRRALGRVVFMPFYRRRLVRIAPALLVLMAVSSLAAHLGGRGGEMAPAIAATILQVADAPDVLGLDLYWLSHMWTLSLEAQFYLVIPLAVIAGFAGPVAALFAAVAVGAISVLYAPVGALATGCALAAFNIQVRSWLGIRALVIVGIGVIAMSVAIDNQSSYYNLLPTLGTSLGSALIITAAAGARTSLRLPGLRQVGVISYSLYLWHLPATALIYPTLYAMGQPWWVATGLSLAVSLAAGSVSYRFIERPFLRRASRPRPATVGAMAGVAA